MNIKDDKYDFELLLLYDNPSQVQAMNLSTELRNYGLTVDCIHTSLGHSINRKDYLFTLHYLDSNLELCSKESYTSVSKEEIFTLLKETKPCI